MRVPSNNSPIERAAEAARRSMPAPFSERQRCQKSATATIAPSINTVRTVFRIVDRRLSVLLLLTQGLARSKALSSQGFDKKTARFERELGSKASRNTSEITVARANERYSERVSGQAMSRFAMNPKVSVNPATI